MVVQMLVESADLAGLSIPRMRTTLTLDEDVAAKPREETRSPPEAQPAASKTAAMSTVSPSSRTESAGVPRVKTPCST